MEVHGVAEIHLQSMEDPMPEELAGWSRQWPHGKPMLAQCVSERLHTVGDLCWSSSWKGAACGEDSDSFRVLCPVEGDCWSTGRVWGFHPLRKKPWQRCERCVMRWPQPPLPINQCPEGERGGKLEHEVKPQKKRGVRRRYFKICFYFLTILLWLD